MKKLLVGLSMPLLGVIIYFLYIGRITEAISVFGMLTTVSIAFLGVHFYMDRIFKEDKLKSCKDFLTRLTEIYNVNIVSGRKDSYTKAVLELNKVVSTLYIYTTKNMDKLLSELASNTDKFLKDEKYYEDFISRFAKLTREEVFE